jgi:hypothetical protein
MRITPTWSVTNRRPLLSSGATMFVMSPSPETLAIEGAAVGVAADVEAGAEVAPVGTLDVAAEPHPAAVAAAHAIANAVSVTTR